MFVACLQLSCEGNRIEKAAIQRAIIRRAASDRLETAGAIEAFGGVVCPHFEENLFGARVARQFRESLYQQSSKSPSAQFGADADQQQFFFARRAARQYKAACFRLAIADQPRFCIDEDRVGMRQGKRIGDLLAGPGFPPVRIESAMAEEPLSHADGSADFLGVRN